LQGVFASFRTSRATANRLPKRKYDMIEIVDESDAPDCCRGFSAFEPFPPVIFLSHPKGALPFTHGMAQFGRGKQRNVPSVAPAAIGMRRVRR